MTDFGEFAQKILQTLLDSDLDSQNVNFLIVDDKVETSSTTCVFCLFL